MQKPGCLGHQIPANRASPAQACGPGTTRVPMVSRTSCTSQTSGRLAAPPSRAAWFDRRPIARATTSTIALATHVRTPVGHSARADDPSQIPYYQ